MQGILKVLFIELYFWTKQWHLNIPQYINFTFFTFDIYQQVYINSLVLVLHKQQLSLILQTKKTVLVY